MQDANKIEGSHIKKCRFLKVSQLHLLPIVAWRAIIRILEYLIIDQSLASFLCGRGEVYHWIELGCRDHFTCMSENLVYCISCRRCSHIYIGETGQSLRSGIGEHLQSIHNNNPGFPMAQHFNSAGHSITDVQVRGMHLCRGSNFLRKQLEMRLIFQLGTVQPDGLNINFKYV